MIRLTKYNAMTHLYELNQDQSSLEAVMQRCGVFEDFYVDIITQQQTIEDEMAILKQEKKEKSLRFRELFYQKILHQTMLSYLNEYKF